MVQHRLPTVQPSRSRYGGENVFVRFGFVVCVIAFVCVFIVLLAGLITSTYW